MRLINFVEFLRKSKHGGKNNYFLQIGKRRRKNIYIGLLAQILEGETLTLRIFMLWEKFSRKLVKNYIFRHKKKKKLEKNLN